VRRILLIVWASLLFMTAPAGAEDWDREETAAFGAYAACNFMDYLQTRQIIGGGHGELNPMIEDLADRMGMTGVTLWFAGSTALTYLLSDTVFKNHRKVFLGVMVGGSASTVIWNWRIGYRFR
jgi:hypothetical protein